MENQLSVSSESASSNMQRDASVALDNVVSENPVIQRALGRLKESQSKEQSHSGFVNHGSHNTHSKSGW
jgi:hypothetical protein